MTGIFRQRKPRKFNYKPVFYNQKKEIRAERMKKWQAYLKGSDVVDYTPSIQKGSFKNNHRSTHRNVHTKSNIRLFIIMILLAFLFYILLIR